VCVLLVDADPKKLLRPSAAVGDPIGCAPMSPRLRLVGGCCTTRNSAAVSAHDRAATASVAVERDEPEDAEPRRRPIEAGELPVPGIAANGGRRELPAHHS